jgi:hypothetical protein
LFMGASPQSILFRIILDSQAIGGILDQLLIRKENYGNYYCWSSYQDSESVWLHAFRGFPNGWRGTEAFPCRKYACNDARSPWSV